MAKKAQQNKISKDSRGISIEHQNIEDDSLLPPAEELARLNEIFAGSTLALIVFYFLRVPKSHLEDNEKKAD
jgi:hypothetical protein